MMRYGMSMRVVIDMIIIHIMEGSVKTMLTVVMVQI